MKLPPMPPPSPTKRNKSSPMSSSMKVPPLNPTKTKMTMMSRTMTMTDAPLSAATTPLGLTDPSEEAAEKKAHKTMMQVLGKGPMRFGPPGRPLVVKEHLMRNQSQFEPFVQIKVGLEGNDAFPDEIILRVALFKNFDVAKTVRLLKRMDPFHWNHLSVSLLAPQLHTHTLFPLPNKLLSKDKTIQSFFYMKPSRHIPMSSSSNNMTTTAEGTPTSTIIANLLYVMDTLSERSSSSSSLKDKEPAGGGAVNARHNKNNKINRMGFIANMSEWRMDQNFSIDYCKQFMDALQGKKGPVKVDMFLIVNPPSFFDKTWQIIKPMLSDSFRRKVFMISSSDLAEYLAPGYEQYLPEELFLSTAAARGEGRGGLDAAQAVKDFILYREYIECTLYPDERPRTKKQQEDIMASSSPACPASPVRQRRTSNTNNSNSGHSSPTKRKGANTISDILIAHNSPPKKSASKSQEKLSNSLVSKPESSERRRSWSNMSLKSDSHSNNNNNNNNQLSKADREMLARVSRHLTRESSSLDDDDEEEEDSDNSFNFTVGSRNNSRRQTRSQPILPCTDE